MNLVVVGLSEDVDKLIAKFADLSFGIDDQAYRFFINHGIKVFINANNFSYMNGIINNEIKYDGFGVVFLFRISYEDQFIEFMAQATGDQLHNIIRRELQELCSFARAVVLSAFKEGESANSIIVRYCANNLKSYTFFHDAKEKFFSSDIVANLL